VESRNVTHLTQRFPVFWEAARGANVRDVDGNVYLDLTGAFGVSVAGHTPPGVADAVRRQAEVLVHGMGDVHPPVGKVELLEALARLAPWPDARVILGSSGSEAVEAALKTALLATGKPGILAFEGAYHGLTLGSLAATHRDYFRAPFAARLYTGARFAPFPSRGPSAGAEPDGARCLEEVGRLLGNEDGKGEVGAVIIEPIQGRAGVRIPPEGFLRELAAMTREAGAVLIFDEIFTGLGRTGELFACLHEGVLPDLLCLGKGLGGGLPLSACLGPARIMDAWPASTGEAIHTSTFLGNPLACAAGVALLRELEEGGLVARSRALGAQLLNMLDRELEPLAQRVRTRGRGLFVGMEMRESESGGPTWGSAVRVSEAALREGILVLPAGEWGQVVELSPPLVVTEEQLRWAAATLARVVGTVVAS
jgi:4-aminobutyrate aminotransferase/(S)-3-amino-2-methylpropionate transaminase